MSVIEDLGKAISDSAETVYDSNSPPLKSLWEGIIKRLGPFGRREFWYALLLDALGLLLAATVGFLENVVVDPLNIDQHLSDIPAVGLEVLLISIGILIGAIIHGRSKERKADLSLPLLVAFVALSLSLVSIAVSKADYAVETDSVRKYAMIYPNIMALIVWAWATLVVYRVETQVQAAPEAKNEGK